VYVCEDIFALLIYVVVASLYQVGQGVTVENASCLEVGLVLSDLKPKPTTLS